MRVVSLNPTTLGSLPVYRADVLAPWGVDAFFTSRVGGVSEGAYRELNLGDHVEDDPTHVETNRRLLARALGVDRLDLPRQVHGTTVVTVSDLRASHPRSADAVVSDSSAPAVVLVADCVPVILVDPDSHRLIVVHAGWRGLASGVLESALGHLRPESTVAFIGPSISQDTYQVGPDVVDAHELFARHARVDVDDRFRLDLRSAAADLLTLRGVDASRVYASTEVTDGGATFFSDRATRPCGRFAAVARWT